MFGDIGLALDEHAAGTAGRIVHAHLFGRLQQFDDQPHHFGGGIELAALLAGRVGKLFYQIFIIGEK